jgi:hypothetical protein
LNFNELCPTYAIDSSKDVTNSYSKQGVQYYILFSTGNNSPKFSRNMESREEHAVQITSPPLPSSARENNNYRGHIATLVKKDEGGEITTRRRVKVILVGCGRMGHVRAKHIYASPRFLLLGIIDVDFSKAKALASYYSVCL